MATLLQEGFVFRIEALLVIGVLFIWCRLTIFFFFLRSIFIGNIHAYCEASMGSQEQKTAVVTGENLNKLGLLKN